jgi:glucuronoarabinoxylan endo-1,4-beta-xylanase
VSHLASTKKSIAVPVFLSPIPPPKELAISLERRPSTHRGLLAAILAPTFFLFQAGSASAQAQTATVNWTNVHQVIDGFGAGNVFYSSSMSSANQQLFFGTGSGQLGLSLLRVAVPNNGDSGGFGISCATVSTACAGQVVGDMQAIAANGGRIYATPFSPPTIYTTNGNTVCSLGSPTPGQLASSHYGDFATWLSNFTLSVKAQGVNIFAIDVQNEPNGCWQSDSSQYSASQLDNFIKNNLGPTISGNGTGTIILMPEPNVYSLLSSLGGTCATDAACNNFLGGYNFHDYGASESGTTVSSTPLPGGWSTSKKYWMTEVSCFTNGSSPAGPSWCPGTGFHGSMSDGLNWASFIDQRMQDSLNAVMYWWLISKDPDDEGLMSNDGVTVAKRAYVFGQYSKFIRPGYYRIDATHLPQTGVSVSAYQNTPSNTLVIIATNYTGSAMPQTFNLTNAPTFSTLTPTITSANLSLAAQSNVSVTGNSFTYTLPANSITTFVGSASTPAAPTNLSGTVVQ